jgi:hypothetical protein
MNNYFLPRVFSATISAGGTGTSAIDLQGYVPVRIHMSDFWTPAPLAFGVYVASGDTSFSLDERMLIDSDGSEYVVFADAMTSVPLQPCIFLGATKIVIYSGPLSNRVNQTAARTLLIVGILP